VQGHPRGRAPRRCASLSTSAMVGAENQWIPASGPGTCARSMPAKLPQARAGLWLWTCRPATASKSGTKHDGSLRRHDRSDRVVHGPLGGDRFPPRPCVAVMPGFRPSWAGLEDHLRPRCQDDQPLSFSALSGRCRTVRFQTDWRSVDPRRLRAGPHESVAIYMGHGRAQSRHGKREIRNSNVGRGRCTTSTGSLFFCEAPIHQGGEMRAAFMSIEEACVTYLEGMTLASQNAELGDPGACRRR